MEIESFDNVEVAKLLNQHFIASRWIESNSLILMKST